jgi:hypothetical protein
VQERLDRGRLVALPLKTLDNGMALCVDVVWSRERPLGLGGRELVEGMVRARAG